MFGGQYNQAAVRSSYESQAEKWKKNAESPWKTGNSSSSSSSSVSELVLISELCSAVGQSSFPPRDALNTLLRQVSVIDHAYVCELLESKLEDRLWQVVARALAVLDALGNTSAATTYLDYFSAHKPLIQYLTQHPKQTVKSRAEKFAIALDNHIPTSQPELADREEGNRSQYEAPSLATRSRQSSVSSNTDSTSGRRSNTRHPSQQQQQAQLVPDLMSYGSSPPRRDLLLGSPQKANQPPPSSLFSPPRQTTTTSAASPLFPSKDSAFSFLQSTSSSTPAPPQRTATSSSAPHSAFSFVSPPSPSSSSPEEPSAASSAFSFLKSSQANTTPTPLFGSSSQPPSSSASAADRITDAFADLAVETPDVDLSDMVSQSDGQSEVSEEMPTPPKPTVSARDEFEALKKAGMAREVILEVELPPGPMGIVLDRTVPDYAILASYAPLPSGAKGLIELHPAICPGCLLVAINGNSIEHLGLADLGPVLASASVYQRVLTFKKFMVGSRVMHPIKLQSAYVPPPVEPEVDTPPLQPLVAPVAAPAAPVVVAAPTYVVYQPPTILAAPAPFVAAAAAPTPVVYSATAPTTSPVSSFSFMQAPAPVTTSSTTPAAPAASSTSAFSFMQQPAAAPPANKPKSPRRQASPQKSAFSFI
ncbi:unnamed protein product [Aphanomyces euteiches]